MKNCCRSVWLRQDGSLRPPAPGKKICMMLSAIGNAAARETLVTAPHMAAIWTGLFNSLLAPNCSSLCWRDDGPGIGRDARSAYSGLLGRYMARAYLIEHEGVDLLVPLDKAKRFLEKTGYFIKKKNPDVYEADWIGWDDSGPVIVEAKGSYCGCLGSLQSAGNQAKNTAVFCSYQELPAKRWAIASRWGTEKKGLKPTLLAWGSKKKQLDDDEDYQALRQILHRADVSGVLEGMGHTIHRHRQVQNIEELIADVPSGRLIINGEQLGVGFAAVVGPFGVRHLRPRDDLGRLLQLLDLDFSYAVSLLSHSYVLEGQTAKATTLNESANTDASELFAIQRSGLTVVWLRRDDNVSFEQE